MFLMKSKCVFLAMVAAALAGCATSQVAMKQQVQANLGQTEGVVYVPQDNLIVTVRATDPGNTGLLGALIIAAVDSAQQSSDEKAAAPLKEELRGYDFRTVVLDATNEALTKADKIKFEKALRIETVSSDSAKRIAFDKSTASAVLFIDVGYRLESGDLLMSASAEMYPRAENLKPFRGRPNETNPLDTGNAVYRKSFFSSKVAVTPSNIKQSLAELAANIAGQLAADLNHGI